MKKSFQTTIFIGIALIVIFSVSACSPITIKERTVWEYNMHNDVYARCKAKAG